MSTKTSDRGRYSSRVHSTIGYLAAIVMGCASMTALSQQPKLSTISSPSGPVNTPRQLITGSAKLVQPYEPASKLRLAISIKAPHVAEEEKLLKDLQDQKSPNFKKYLTPEQWNARFAPAAADEQAVVDWAASQGLTVLARYPNRLIVNVEGTVDSIQKAFNISINKYEVNGAVEFSNDRDPQLPSHLQNIIQYVDGLNSINRMRPANSKMQGVRPPDYSPGAFFQNGPSIRTNAAKATLTEPSKGESKPGKSTRTEQSGSQITNGYLDPSDIFSSNLYNYSALMAQGHCCNPTGNSGGTPPETTIALATDGDFANSDVLSFASIYGLQFQGYRIFVGGTPSCCDDETTLDFEWSSTTANSFSTPQASSTILVYEAANGFGDFGSVFNQMVTDNDMRVVNISYGLNESYLNGQGLVSSWHSIFNQMLGQGMTIMAAAGDGGATAGCGDSIAVLYPGSDPDVVSVGGTQAEIYSDGSFASEVAWTGGTYSGACSQNNGGTGGGCSVLFAAPGYQTNNGNSPACGSGSRSVPDVALNAATGQNYYFNGSLSGVGGTSISSPMFSGFMAQSNAYLLGAGLSGAPAGEVDYKLYWLGEHNNASYEEHYPFYDVLSGCNSNDVTAEYGLGSYCAGTGYDLVTGWGTINALQLAWGINTYDNGNSGGPQITFSGPSITQGTDNWYNTNQVISWTVAAPSNSVAGFSQAWDSSFYDPTSEPTPGAGNSFYSGPEFPNATSGYLNLSDAGQGCHYATVYAWDNTGFTSGNQFFYYVCYDTIAPTVSVSNNPSANSYGYDNQAVKVTVSAADQGSAPSGISKTYYAFDSSPCAPSALSSCSVYSGPITFTSTGHHHVTSFTQDVAGNFSAVNQDQLYIDETAPVTTATLSGTLDGSVYDTAVKVTLSATDNFSGVLKSAYFLDGGSYTQYSAPFTVSSLGSHSIKYYSEDKAGNYETEKTVTFTIESKTSTTLTASPSPALVGQTVKLTATVKGSLSGTPTGTVTFKNGSTTLGTGTLSGGVATLSTTKLPFGTDSLTASYGGATNYFASTSSTVAEEVRQTSTTKVTSSVNPSVFGQSVTLTSTVTAQTSGTPTGTVEFLSNGTSIGTSTLSGGKATLVVTTFTVKAHSITATYSGSSSYQSSTSSTLTQTVNKANTTATVTSSLNPSTSGAKVTFTATIKGAYTGTPTGTVTFTSNGSTIGSGTLSGGKATFSITTLPVGTHQIKALYGGDGNFNVSTSGSLAQVVNQ